jgi:serine/threonine-protein kinase
MMAALPSWIGLALAGGRYQITARVPGGGMAEVYRAWDRNLETEVIIKVPLMDLVRNSVFVARFSREIRSLVRLSHPHIVKVIDVGDYQGYPFAVLQYLAGGSLRDRQFSPRGTPQGQPPASVAGWLPGIAGALDFIHGEKFVHRDVKPGNILFDRHGNSYLSDFGIIKTITGEGAEELTQNLTQRGMVLGTLQYMAPEVFLKPGVDGRVDQYALGITVYEALFGRPPFSGDNPADLMMQQTKAQPPLLHEMLPHIPEPVSRAVARALAKDPSARFRTCQEFAQAVTEGLRAPASAVCTAVGPTVHEPTPPPKPVPAPAPPAAAPVVAESPPAPTPSGPRLENVALPCPLCQEMVTVTPADRGGRVRCVSCRAELSVLPDLRRLTVASIAKEGAPANMPPARPGLAALQMPCPVCQEMIPLSAAHGGQRLQCPSCRADLMAYPDLRRLTTASVPGKAEPQGPPAEEPPAPMTFSLPVNTEEIAAPPMTFNLRLDALEPAPVPAPEGQVSARPTPPPQPAVIPGQVIYPQTWPAPVPAPNPGPAQPGRPPVPPAFVPDPGPPNDRRDPGPVPVFFPDEVSGGERGSAHRAPVGMILLVALLVALVVVGLLVSVFFLLKSPPEPARNSSSTPAVGIVIEGDRWARGLVQRPRQALPMAAGISHLGEVLSEAEA